MAALTPKRSELARQIRIASAQLRSPVKHVPAARRIELAAAAQPSASKVAKASPSEAAGAVDLRVLRLQMERSLARLQAGGDLSPPQVECYIFLISKACIPCSKQRLPIRMTIALKDADIYPVDDSYLTVLYEQHVLLLA